MSVSRTQPIYLFISGVFLKIGFNIVQEDMMEQEEIILKGSSSRGVAKSKKVKVPKISWVARELEDVTSDHTQFIQDIRGSLLIE